MPSALPQFAFDGGTAVAQEAAPSTVDPAPSMPDQADRPDSSTVLSAGPDASQADQTYPLLPLTVVPKPEASPLASLKAPDDRTSGSPFSRSCSRCLSAMTFIFWRYHRRDYASPRRIGRRI